MTPLVSLVMLVGAAAPVAPPARGAIERVVVFADRAEVTRVQGARCVGGAASVVFAEIPDAVDPRTLRCDADSGATAVGVSTASVALGESLDARVRALQDEQQAHDDQLAVLARADEDAARRTATWAGYGGYFRALVAEDMRQPKPDTGRWEQVLRTFEGESDAATAATVAREAERRVLTRKRERVQAQLARLNPAVAPTRLDATVAVQCGASAAPTVRLSYVVPGATWHPEYDVRFTPSGKAKVGDGNALLTVGGVVTQSTGEDWLDAEIALSTAKPALGGEAPIPYPILVSAHPEDRQKTLVQGQEHRADDLRRGKTSGATAAGAELEDGGKAFVLRLPRKASVRADGRPYWFPIDELTSKATSSLVAVPARAPYVYQVASLNNPAGFPLMAGDVHVFRGATFVGTVAVEYLAPGEPMEISLGIDEEIEVERKDLLQQKREAGLFSGSQSVAHAYRTIVHNRSDGDVVVQIREQVPVSKTADIKVTLDPAGTTAGYTLDKLRGHLRWAIALKRGATSQRDVAFTIELPKDWAVQ